MSNEKSMIDTLLKIFPELQAIYVFGTWGNLEGGDPGDVDLALLLAVQEAKQAGNKAMHEAGRELESTLGKEVDLINLRLANTVLQKEVIATGHRIYCADAYKADEFEMLTLSFYQKLNEERAGILTEVLRSGRIYAI